MKKHQKRGGKIYTNCLPLCVISPSSVALKKATLDEVGIFNEDLPACEDYDLWLRICAHHKVHYIETPLLKKYGGHADQLSGKYWGLDRFRIKALTAMLDQPTLSLENRNLTLTELHKKAAILLKGAEKHSNINLIAECNAALKQYPLTTQ